MRKVAGSGRLSIGPERAQLVMKACSQCQLRYPPEALYCFVDGAELCTVRDPLIGAVIAGRYVVEDIIGQGGMATVYRARHELDGRLCAIKVMSPALAADATVHERFRREIKSVISLAHPNIVEILDHGETADGTPYMVMELLDGGTLADLVGQGAVPLRRALPILVQLARGIARAHDLGVVHRDLKPDNVFLCRLADGGDLVKILDFGIARSQSDPRLTGAGELFGTPQYMAPERVTTGEAGPSVDLYALGVVFYEVVTGKLPFEASDPTAFLVKHLKERPVSPRLVLPGIPPELDALVMGLLEKDPRARPVDAHRVERDLVALANGAGARLPPDAESDPVSSRARMVPSDRDRGARVRSDWVGRVDLFGEMLAQVRAGRAYASDVAAGGDAERLLEHMATRARELDDVRRAAALEQSALEELDQRGREGRHRFGAAVHALGLDASRARDGLRGAREDVARGVERSKSASAAYEAALRDALRWEGRAGFAEPHPMLAEAYRRCAELVDAWVAARRDERAARDDLEGKERLVADLDYQLAELRSALASHEQSVDREHEALRRRLLDLNVQAEGVHAELVACASRFCEPLRARPELAPLFRRLESEAAPRSASPAE